MQQGQATTSEVGQQTYLENKNSKRHSKSCNKSCDKLNILDFLNKNRLQIYGLQAIWIWLYHMSDLIDASRHGLYITGIILRSGYVGTDIFMLLAGIGAYQQLTKHNTITFYKNRLSRIWIPQAIFLIINSIINNSGVHNLILELSGISYWTNKSIDTKWFVWGILGIYLIQPLYIKLFKRVKNKNHLIACQLLIQIIIGLGHYGRLGLTICRLTIFILGIYIGYLIQNSKKLEIPLWVILVAQMMQLLTWVVLIIKYQFNMFGEQLNIILIVQILGVYQLIADKIKKLAEKHSIKYKSKILTYIGSRQLEIYLVAETSRNILYKTIGQTNIALIFLMSTIQAEIMHQLQKLVQQVIKQTQTITNKQQIKMQDQ